MSENTEYVLHPKTGADEQQFIRITESLRNLIASLNNKYLNRAKDGKKLVNGKCDAGEYSIPGRQVFTERQFSVINVQIMELWQTALTQSLIQGRPIIYEEDAFGTDPEKIDTRELPDKQPHVSLIYFGDEFEIGEVVDVENKYEITFDHSPININPTATFETDKPVTDAIGVQLIAYEDKYCIEPLLNPETIEGDSDGGAWWVDELYEPGENEKLDELLKKMDNTSIEEDPSIIHDVVDFIAKHEFVSDEGPQGFSDILRMILVANDCTPTAEFRNHQSPLRQRLAEYLDIQVYKTDNTVSNGVFYNNYDELPRLKAFDRAIKATEDNDEITRLMGWMHSIHDKSLTFTVNTELPSEQNLIDVVNYLDTGEISGDLTPYLLLGDFHYDSTTPENVETAAKYRKAIIDTFEEFDKEYGTTTTDDILLPTWAFRGDLLSVNPLRDVLNGRTAQPGKFWRL